MSIIQMSEEEKKKILDKHKEATKGHYLKKDEIKKGLQKPKKEENEKPSN